MWEKKHFQINRKKNGVKIFFSVKNFDIRPPA